MQPRHLQQRCAVYEDAPKSREITSPSPRSQAKHLQLRAGGYSDLWHVEQQHQQTKPTKTRSNSKTKTKKTKKQKRRVTKSPKHEAPPVEAESDDPDEQDVELQQITALLEALKHNEFAGADDLPAAIHRVQEVSRIADTLKKELQCHRRDLELYKSKQDTEISRLRSEAVQLQHHAQNIFVDSSQQVREDLEWTRLDWKNLRQKEEDLESRHEALTKTNATLESEFNLMSTTTQDELSIATQRLVLESLRSQIAKENELRPKLLEGLEKSNETQSFLKNRIETVQSEIAEHRRGCQLLDHEYTKYAAAKEGAQLAKMQTARILKQSELAALRKEHEAMAQQLKLYGQGLKLGLLHESEELTGLNSAVLHLNADRDFLTHKLDKLNKQLKSAQDAQVKMQEDQVRLQALEKEMVQKYVEIKSEVKQIQLLSSGKTRCFIKRTANNANPFKSRDAASARLSELSQKYSSLEASERQRKEWKDWRSELTVNRQFSERTDTRHQHVVEEEDYDHDEPHAAENPQLGELQFKRKLGLASDQTFAMMSKGDQGRFSAKEISKLTKQSGTDLGSTQDTKHQDLSAWKFRSSGGTAKKLARLGLAPLQEESEP